jgi:putative DNA primase/helicase
LEFEMLDSTATVDAAVEDIIPPAFTDSALQERFTQRYGDSLRYVAAWGRWLTWDGTRWELDETMLGFDLAHKICKEASAECNKQKVASSIASAKTVAAVERLSRADRMHAATVDQWDADTWLANTPVGIIDLRTNEIRKPDPDAYMTKLTGVAPDKRPIPTWRKFLHRIMGGDAELIAYLQRLAGYAMTGSTREHSINFFYGTGANGKTTFINAIAGCLGDYHRAAPIETFTTSNSERHPTDLAGLRGARLVTATETQEGRRWAESRIKQLTGGDKISARFMRQDFFEYTPQFTLLIAGNHKPGLRSVDEAMRRRFHLIPFTVTIPPDERDRELDAKLREEWPGILHWMIEGCLEWQRIGLAPPKAVTAATDAYLGEQDAIAAWVEERVEKAQDAWVPRDTLFAEWSRWANAAGDHVGSRTRLYDALERLGLEPSKRDGTRGFLGIRLKRQEYSDGYYDR